MYYYLVLCNIFCSALPATLSVLKWDNQQQLFSLTEKAIAVRFIGHNVKQKCYHAKRKKKR